MKLYCDLDGVFADFARGVFEITGVYPEQLSTKELWNQLKRVDHFYLTLVPIPGTIKWFKELHRRSLLPIEMLTGLPVPAGKFSTAAEDKRVWVKQYLDRHIPVNCTTRRGDKAKFIESSTDVLIDDNDQIIKDWNAAGGVGIVHVNWKMTFSELTKFGVLR